MKEVVFHEFSPEIYPRKIWMVKGASKEAISERFHVDKDYLEQIGEINHGEFNAECIPIFNIETLKKGILCNLSNKHKLTVDTIAHESVHIADYIFEELGMVSQNFSERNEQYAYLVGWIAKCFTEVK